MRDVDDLDDCRPSLPSPQEEADALLAWLACTEDDTLAWIAAAAQDDAAILAALRALDDTT